jgi:hypothetical protein
MGATVATASRRGLFDATEEEEEEGEIWTDAELKEAEAAAVVPPTVTAGGARTVEEELAPPGDDDAGAPSAPTGTSAAPPNMRIDTTIASHTAVLRGAIDILAHSFYGLKPMGRMVPRTR